MGLLAAAFVFALNLNTSQGMQPRVLLGGPHIVPSDTLTVQEGHIVVSQTHVIRSEANKSSHAVEVQWDGETRKITEADEKASADWMQKNSLLPRLSIKHHNLMWDGKKVDLGKTIVTDLYQAIPWNGGVLIYGRTYPRRGFFGSWPFKGSFIEARDMEPYCAIFFDPRTLKGEDRWLNGKVARPFFVFPIPQ